MNHNMFTTNTTTQELQIEVNGRTVSYIDEGKGASPIMFVHGFPFDKSSWQYQIEALKTVTRVVAYDLRGFGRLSSGEASFSMDLFADDLIALMDALNIEKCIVCGLSMGGYIVFNALQRYPDRFDAAILCNTQCIEDSEEARQKRYKSIEDIRNGGKEAFADAFLKKIFTEESLSLKHGIVQETKEVIMATSDLSLIGTLEALAQRKNTCGILKDITVPVLLLCGNEDQTIAKEQSIAIEHELTVSSIHIIEGAGHMAQLEQPELFNRYIGEFVGKYKLLSNIE